MKGIILAGGRATRLYPLTKAACKQLLPVYDKPMIYYPLSVLLLAGIKDILLISSPEYQPKFKELFGDGRNLGISISYAAQNEPEGIAQAFIIAEDFIGNDSVCLILGDNIFYGNNLSSLLKKAAAGKNQATIFGYYVKDPGRYGVIEFDKKCAPLSITEKPAVPKSNYAVTGLYFYDNKVVEIAKSLKPSKRKELEITDINNTYLKKRKLRIELLGRGYCWLDMGTYESLIEAALFMKTIEDRQGLKVGCIEEIAYRSGFMTFAQLKKAAAQIPTAYGEYLNKILKE
ncbi:MAG: glucose-1-phosphate thymidylyltransferase RfbA [Candidatus Omnitrophica bacterium]|nr:glucose-1-phosphate thymidylyltransferase RfbA [Candidatus Omnitrophota bacterium]